MVLGAGFLMQDKGSLIDEYKIIFENAPLGFIIFDAEGVITDCNDVFVEIMGSSREKILGLRLLELPDRRIVSAVRTALDGGLGLFEGEYCSITSGKRVPLRALYKTTEPQNGMPIGIGIIEDISGRVATEKALRASEEKFRKIFENSNDGMMLCDSQGRVTDWNRAHEAMTGVSKQDALGKYLWDLQFAFAPKEHRTPEVYEKMRSSLLLAIKTGSAPFLNRPIEGVLVPPTGRLVYIENVGFTIPTDDGFLFGGRVTNITERKNAEVRIKALLEEKSLLLREVHHRIKNNMATVSGLLNLQAGTLQDPVAVSALKDAAHRVQSMMILYEKLYTVETVGALSLQIYLPALVDEIIRNFSSPFPVEIEKQVEDVALDPKVLQSLGIIINEIITNIMKYAFIGRNGGKIILRAYREQERVYIEVADNGVGMDESITFEKTPGFGLMLIKILTEQLRGSIRIDRNGGTKIGIAFPATDA